jgi:hypothetical protein
LQRGTKEKGRSISPQLTSKQSKEQQNTAVNPSYRNRTERSVVPFGIAFFFKKMITLLLQLLKKQTPQKIVSLKNCLAKQLLLWYQCKNE